MEYLALYAHSPKTMLILKTPGHNIEWQTEPSFAVPTLSPQCTSSIEERKKKNMVRASNLKIPQSEKDIKGKLDEFGPDVQECVITSASSNAIINTADIYCLESGQYLNDNIINAYALAAQDINISIRELDGSVWRLAAYSSLLSSTLGRHREVNRNCMAGFKRTFDSLNLPEDITTIDAYILAPFNIGNHWLLYLISITDATIYKIDSLCGDATRVEDAPQYLAQMVDHHMNLQRVWKYYTVACAQQNNFTECGAHVIENMLNIAHGKELRTRFTYAHEETTWSNDIRGIIRKELIYAIHMKAISAGDILLS